ncbi:MAG: lactate utilization protein LutB domain-containing protein, partial [Chloroflexota bacterium]
SQLADASTLCGACKDACPIDIDLPALILRVRSRKESGSNRKDENEHNGSQKKGFLTLFLTLYSQAASHPKIFTFGQNLAALVSRFFPAYIKLPSFTGWGAGKDLPAPAPGSNHDRYTGQTSSIYAGQPASSQRITRNISESQPANLPENVLALLPALKPS